MQNNALQLRMSQLTPMRHVLLCLLVTLVLALPRIAIAQQAPAPKDAQPASDFQVPIPGTQAPTDEIIEDEPATPKNGGNSPANTPDADDGNNDVTVENNPDRAPGLEVPEIQRDLSTLPVPVRRMRELILEVAKSGDIEKLRNLIEIGENGTTLSLGELEGDVIDYLKRQSGDPDGREMLAIIVELLEIGFVHLDKGTEQEMYVWPYFVAWPIDRLTPQQTVELFTIIAAGDYEDMKDFGAYIFYRIGISPKGQWRFFVAGD